MKLYKQLSSYTREIHRDIHSAVSLELDNAKKDYISNETFYKRTIYFMSFLIFLECFIFILLSIILINSISKRLNNHLEFAKEIACGKLDSTIKVDSNDEIGVLGKTLNTAFNNTKKLMNEIKDSEKQLKIKIEELSTVQNQLKIDKERYELAVEGANDGIWDIDLLNNTIYISNKCKYLLDIDKSENTFDLAYCHELFYKFLDKSSFKNYVKNLIEKQIHICYKEFKYLDSEGKEKIFLLRGKIIWDENKKPYRMAGSITDVTTERKANEKAKYLAYYNKLLGIPNMTYLLNNLPEYIEYTPKDNIGAILALDIDNFKSINEVYNRKIGDETLKFIANRLKYFSSEDKIFSLNGDNFIIYCNKFNTKEQIEKYVQNLIDIFKNPFVIKNNDIYLSISIGISCYPEDSTDPNALIKNAEIALRYCKEKNKNSYNFYNPSMEFETKEKILIKSRLVKAIINKEFQLYYQPKINLKNNKIDGMETLVRWIHPLKGLILPSNFIPIAEESGLIVPIGKFVLKEACRQNKYWQDKGLSPLKVAVNISAKQIQQDDFVDIVKNVLKSTNLSSKYLELEVTESTIMSNFDLSVSKLQELKNLGIRISLDDFGTGYSSLNYLRRLPIDSIKIDKSFIDNITKIEKDKFITSSLIDLAHGLNLTVVAEGVETEAQLNILKEFNCDIIQGYLFSKPLDKEGFEKIAMQFF
ncbi:cyclic di-GMP phosphodiesterase Gmr [Clostridium acetireducens DSM 10703]|uniref:Cyclic di-GMP phosphodiesterase Gmr n=1 Tax=Clostridium acetireducens DSM 10703 TaxID=1121290 RepID=A0A1E8EWP7_9CLOT|nr:EAL domain-containing protein [Clostridium acetireducens]OFI05067.1 cyclic di-GMP phosphodiesterase Gmr [Clostridium acetireducens DSM 10703]